MMVRNQTGFAFELQPSLLMLDILLRLSDSRSKGVHNVHSIRGGILNSAEPHAQGIILKNETCAWTPNRVFLAILVVESQGLPTMKC